MLLILLLFIFAYLLGSIPTSVIFGKTFKGIDIREHGSKNSGATNAGRVLGIKWFFIVLFFDALKGAIPVVLAIYLGIPSNIALIIGIVAILGHTFSLYMKFKGGKGMATSLGVVVVLAPLALLFAVIVFVIVTLLSKYVSLGSILAAISFPIFVFYVYSNSKGWLMYVSILLVIYIIYKHKKNIVRILTGTENKIRLKRRS